MKFEEYQEKMEQLSKLISQSNTGTPAELAKRLKVSERTIRRLVERLKLKDDSIRFCRRTKTYTKN